MRKLYLSSTALVLAVAAQAHAQTIAPPGSASIADNQPYAAGNYMGYIAPFNKGSLLQGRDYTQSETITPGTFPNGTTLHWNWPNARSPNGIYTFNAIDYGYYANTAVPNPIPSKTVDSLGSLTETHSLSQSGAPQNYDVIDDIFLTKSPKDTSTMAAEVEVFLHTPDYSAQYVKGSAPIGTFQSNGITWTVAKSSNGSAGLDLLFMPSNQADVSSGTIDLKGMLNYLVQQGAISGSWYFNGYALGAEVMQGSGSVTMNNWSTSYDTPGVATGQTNQTTGGTANHGSQGSQTTGVAISQTTQATGGTTSQASSPSPSSQPEATTKSAPASDQTIAPGQGSLTDATGNVWTITPSGSIMNGNTYTPGGGGTSSLMIVNGTVYGQDAHGRGWFALSGTGATQFWTSVPAPPNGVRTASSTTPSGKSPSGTTTASTTPKQVAPAQTPCPSSSGGGTGAFTVQNGQIIGPDGKPFIARGINIMHGQDPSVSEVQNLFTGVNFIRLAIYQFDDPNSLASEVNEFTSKGIVIELENHLDSNGANNGGGQGSVYSGAQLANEQNWYSSVAKAFAGNPYVWFGTKNEPPASDPTALANWQRQTYNTIRGAGNNNPVMIEANCDPTNLCNSGFPASAYAPMKNVIWDQHFYNWVTNSSDVNTNIAMIEKMAASLRPFTSADGVMPVLIGEYGNSTDGQTIDAGGDASVQAVINEGGAGKIGSAAWAWLADGGDALLANKAGAARSSPYGDEVALYINTDTVAPSACQVNNAAAQTVANAMQAATQPAGTTTNVSTAPTTPTDTIPETASAISPPSPAVKAATQQAQADTAAADAILAQVASGPSATTGQQTFPVQ